jgi:hypothetical protein
MFLVVAQGGFTSRPVYMDDLAFPYDRTVKLYSGYYYSINDDGSVDSTTSTSLNVVVQDCLTDLTGSGGSVFLCEVAWDSSLSIPEGVMVIEQLDGEQKRFINSADSQGSPYTISVTDETNYHAQDRANNYVNDWESINASLISQSVFDSLDSNYGGLVTYLRGRYNFDVEVDVSGIKSLTIAFECGDWTDTTYGFFPTSSSVTNLFSADNTLASGFYNLEFRNLKMYGNYPTWNTNGILVKSSGNTIIENCVATKFYYGFDLRSGGDKFTVSGNSATYCHFGIAYTGSNSVFFNNYGNNATDSVHYIGGVNNDVIGCQAYYSLRGIYLYQGSTNNVIGGKYYLCTAGVSIFGSGSGNQVTNARLYNNTYGVYLDASSASNLRNTITTNYIYGNDYGVFEGTGGGTIDYNEITNNIFYENTLDTNLEGANSRVYANQGFVTENTVLSVTNTTATTFVFEHGCDDAPDSVLCQFNAVTIAEIKGYSATSNSTYTTVTVYAEDGKTLPATMTIDSATLKYIP